MRGSRLAALLVEQYGLTPDAAKKRISRARPPIQKLRIPLLPKNESFVYHEQDRDSERFRVALVHDLKESNSICGIALSSLEARGGLVQRHGFDVISGAPIAQRKQVSSSVLLSRLVSAEIVEPTVVGEVGECVRFRDGYGFVLNEKGFRAQVVAESVLLDGLREWARRLGMASYNLIRIRDSECSPRFGPFHWDLCGPSYLLPLLTKMQKGTSTKPGFLVADVFCGRSLEQSHIEYVRRKTAVLNTTRGIVPFLPMIVADSYTSEALRSGHSAGIIMATTKNLFGETVAKALQTLIQTLIRATEVVTRNPEQLIQLLDDLRALEGEAGNLRGALFEMIVAFLVRAVDGNNIDIGKVVRDPETGERAEIDVLRIKANQEFWAYECKARAPAGTVGRREVEEWFRRINRIHKIYRTREEFQRHRFGFEIWTTGNFDEDAQALLKAEKKERTRIRIEWKDGRQVREYAKRANHKAILDTLDEHYFRSVGHQWR